jgi:hypothetical protein
MKALPIGPLTPAGILPGSLPGLDGAVGQFYQEHGRFPVLVLVPRPLSPGRVLSWQAFLAPGPHGPVTVPLASEDPAKNLVPQGDGLVDKSPSSQGGGKIYHPRARTALPPHRPRETSPEVDQEIEALGDRGFGARLITRLLNERGIKVSVRLVSRRLAAAQRVQKRPHAATIWGKR